MTRKQRKQQELEQNQMQELYDLRYKYFLSYQWCCEFFLKHEIDRSEYLDTEFKKVLVCFWKLSVLRRKEVENVNTWTNLNDAKMFLAYMVDIERELQEIYKNRQVNLYETRNKMTDEEIEEKQEEIWNEMNTFEIV